MKRIALWLLTALFGSTPCFAATLTCKNVFSDAEFQKATQLSAKNYKLLERNRDEGNGGKALDCSYIKATATLQIPEAGDVLISVSWWPGHGAQFADNAKSMQETILKMDPQAKEVKGLGTLAFVDGVNDPTVHVLSSHKKYLFLVAGKISETGSLAERSEKAKAIARITNENLKKY